MPSTEVDQRVIKVKEYQMMLLEYLHKTYVVGIHLKHITKALLMSTHNMFSMEKLNIFFPELLLNTFI